MPPIFTHCKLTALLTATVLSSRAHCLPCVLFSPGHGGAAGTGGCGLGAGMGAGELGAGMSAGGLGAGMGAGLSSGAKLLGPA